MLVVVVQGHLLFIIINVGSGGTRFGIDMHTFVLMIMSAQLKYGACIFYCDHERLDPPPSGQHYIYSSVCICEVFGNTTALSRVGDTQWAALSL